MNPWIRMSTMCTCGEMEVCAESGDNMFMPHINRRTGEPCPGFLLSHWEVNMNPDQAEWYEAMAKALKTRDHAVKMIARWTQQLQDSEAAVEKLSASQRVDTATEQQVPHEAYTVIE